MIFPLPKGDGNAPVASSPSPSGIGRRKKEKDTGFRPGAGVAEKALGGFLSRVASGASVEAPGVERPPSMSRR